MNAACNGKSSRFAGSGKPWRLRNAPNALPAGERLEDLARRTGVDDHDAVGSAQAQMQLQGGHFRRRRVVSTQQVVGVAGESLDRDVHHDTRA
jgi:hypothetical protein